MISWLNSLFLLASVQFLAVLFMNTLRNPPPPEKLARWRLGAFWAGRGLWRASALMFSLTALAGVVVVVAGGVGAAWVLATPWLPPLALGLAVVSAGSLLFSVVLYWRPSAAKPNGF